MTQPDAEWPAGNIVLEDFENGDTLDPAKFADQILSAIQYLATHHVHTGFPDGGILNWTFGRVDGVDGLTIQNDATTPNSKMVVTADSLVVYDGTSKINLVTAINVTIDITVTGANGRDAGSEAANTFYYIWVIRKSSDGTVAGLFSTSATAPTMPTGYDQKRRVGCVRNNGSSNFQPLVQRGDYVQFQDDDIGVFVNGVGDTTTWQTVQITAIPSVARVAVIQTIMLRGASGTSNALLVRTNGSAGAGQRAGQLNQSGGTGETSARHFDMIINSSREMQWSTEVDIGDTILMRCVGWREAIGPIA